MMILIVEDQASNRKILRHYLEAQGGTVIEASNGTEALELASQKNPDMIISDIQMPGMDGFQLLREIRQRPALAATPFIFYSAVYTGAADSELALDLGADAFIVKPKDPEEFWTELQTALKQSKDRKHQTCEKLLLDEKDFLRKYNAVVAGQLDETVQSLRSFEALFQATFEQAAVGLAHVALDGHWLDLNSKLCEITGYSKAELFKLTCKDLTLPDDHEIDQEQTKALLANEISNYTSEKRLIRKDGVIISVNLNVSLLRTPDGNPRCFILVVEDITPRLQAEANVRESRSNYHELLCSIVDGMIITDGKGVVTLLNQAVETLPGLIQETVLGRPVEETVADAGLSSYIRSCLNGNGIGVALELQLLDPASKENRDFQAVTSVSFNEQDQPNGSITLLREVTAERESSRLKSEFIATAAHGLRTPLTVVMGYVELLLNMDEDNPTQRREGLSIIADNARALEKIVDDLFDMSQVRTWRTLSLDRKKCNLGELLSNIVQKFREEVDSKKFALSIGNLPLSINLDSLKITQVIEELIDNAINFSSKDSPIQLSCGTLGDEVQISVRDEGIGMTAKQVGRAFEKFYRVDAGDTARQGWGLGLPIAKNIVEAHGGQIWINSDPGRGTEVIFSLPVTP